MRRFIEEKRFSIGKNSSCLKCEYIKKDGVRKILLEVEKYGEIQEFMDRYSC